MNTLATEVTKFREWAIVQQSPHTPGYSPGQFLYGAGEWECNYPDWHSLYTAIDDFLAAASHRTLTDTELELLLYVLARDNEDERVLYTLEEFPSIAMQLVQAAVSFPDTDARWQAAVLAGCIGAAVVVRQFLNDEAEYVRRRAAAALQEMEGRA